MRALEVLVDRRQCVLETGSGGNREVDGGPSRKPCGRQEKSQPGDGAPNSYSACGFHRLLDSSTRGERSRNQVRSNTPETVMSSHFHALCQAFALLTCN